MYLLDDMYRSTFGDCDARLHPSYTKRPRRLSQDRFLTAATPPQIFTFGDLWKIESNCFPFINLILGNWYLSTQCSVSCGYGIETWRRTCDKLSSQSERQSCTMSGKDIKYQICKRQPCPSTSMHKMFKRNKLKF